MRNKATGMVNRLRGKQTTQPFGDYPSDIIDSQGCEFGYEMFYHLPYAYHLARIGRLRRTVSCQSTKCFYFFSPDHREVYDKRNFVYYFDSIAQVPHETPDLVRWEPPPLAEHYGGRLDFGFDRPPFLISNKFNIEWDHPPINYLSMPFLMNLVDQLKDEYTIVYNRPTSHIVHDHMPVGDMNEKIALKQRGVVLAEDLYEQHQHVPFNEFQLCLLAESESRISVQGGAAYLNAFFPGRLWVYHRYGAEQIHGNYDDFPKMGVDDFTVFDCEFAMLEASIKKQQAA